MHDSKHNPWNLRVATSTLAASILVLPGCPADTGDATDPADPADPTSGGQGTPTTSGGQGTANTSGDPETTNTSGDPETTNTSGDLETTSTTADTTSTTADTTSTTADTDDDSGLEQYTPDQAFWDTFATKPIAGGNTAHDPDGVVWITPDDWAAAQWDGTIFNPSKMTPEAFAAAICPSVDRVRGLREVFYQHAPFADNANPTKAEVDEWHRIAINHVRALVGYTSEDRQVTKDHCMFARALWGDERKFTTMWDAKYPGEQGSAAGPCQGSKNAHCGASFIPDLEDQAAYLPPGHPGCTAAAGSEGVFSGPKSNIPWAIKWSRGLCNTLLAEGFWGGHVMPWFHREKFGFSFWDDDPQNNNNNAILRAKWTGNSMPSLYCNPADPGCDPNMP